MEIDNGLSFDNVIVHAPYVMNMANPDPEKQQFAVDFLTSEIQRTAKIGAKNIVVHPGAHVKEGVEVEEEMLSAVMIEHKGNTVRVGSGFSIEQRHPYRLHFQ